MIAEKVFAEGVAKDIRNYLPPEYENADFQVVQKNKNNGVQLIGVQVNLPGKDLSPIIYVEQFFDEIRQGEPVDEVRSASRTSRISARILRWCSTTSRV